MIQKRYLVSYDLNHQNQIIVNCFNNRNTLPTILKKIIQNNPLIDEQIILAHILNVAKDNMFYFSKSQIRYCFNQFYNKDFHSDKKSYLTFLYGLQIPVKNINSVISKSKKAYFRAKKNRVMSNEDNLKKECEPENNAKHLSSEQIKEGDNENN